MACYCSNPWTTLFIWGNGDATHCCYGNWGPVGNIHRTTIDEIWKGPGITAVRNAMGKGDFVGAGCEPFCRVFRWNRFFGSRENPPAIPQGLGRVDHHNICLPTPRPAIIGLGTSWRCNLRCTHCQAPRNASGLNDAVIQNIWPWVESSQVVRLMDGEFSVNPQSLGILARISRMPHQPLVFMNTNGQVPLAGYWSSIEKLQTFHLKYSLEGLSKEYESIRRGGSWDRFCENLADARQRFSEQRERGKDWRLFLNFCVMRSNFPALPGVVAFAAETGVPLVLNALYGARNIDENFGLYKNAAVGNEEISRVEREINATVSRTGYPYSGDLLLHFDYIARVMRDDMKITIPEPLRQWLRRRPITPLISRMLYICYIGRFNQRALALYITRKLRKRAALLLGSSPACTREKVSC